MYTVIMNDGNYREINAIDNKQALSKFYTMFTEEERKGMELIDNFGITVKED